EKEISLRDILEAKEAILKMKMETDKLEYRRKRFTTLLTMGGVLYTVIGLLVYLFQNKNFSIQTDLGLMIALVGVFTFFLGFFYTQLLQRRSEYLRTNDDYKEILFDYEIIQRWQIIENLGSKIMLKKGYNEKESKSIYGILNLLSEELIDENKAKDIKQLLTIRNKVLHESYHLTRTERNRYITMADDIIGILEQAERNTTANK
ncbi:MAG: hypothetical protein IT250_03440, partial [Chitinophagaceae bacterium]|nr:hypothetical protein [Chitinophagaceae bacterium]